MNTFLEHLKDELCYQGLTQKELSEKTGISVNTIRGWFSKDFTPDIFSAIKIAKALNVSTDYLISGKRQKDDIPAEDLSLLNDYHLLTQPNKDLLRAIIISMIQLNNK